MQPKWRDFDTAHIFLGSGFQPRVALGGKTHLMAAANLMKIIPRSCHAFRARSAKVLGPLVFDEFEVVMDEVLSSR